MPMSCSYELRRLIIRRLARIEGQIRGISKMLIEDRNSVDILQQIESAQSALKGVWRETVRAHLNECITRRSAENDDYAIIDDIINRLDKIK